MNCKKTTAKAMACQPAPVPPLDEDAPNWVRLHDLRINEVAHRVDPPDWRGMNNHMVLNIEGLYNSVAAEIKMPYDQGAAEELRKMFNHEVEIIIVRKGAEVIFK